MAARLEITQRLARLRLHAVQHTQLDLQCLRHDGPDVHGDVVAHAERPVVLGQPREIRRQLDERAVIRRLRTTPVTVCPAQKRAAFSAHVPSSSRCVRNTRRCTRSSVRIAA